MSEPTAVPGQFRTEDLTVTRAVAAEIAVRVCTRTTPLTVDELDLIAKGLGCDASDLLWEAGR